MQATRTSEGDQRVVARVVAAFHGDHPNRFLHGGIGNIENSLRERFHRWHSPAGTLHPQPRAAFIQWKFSAEQRIRAKVAENQVRVGDGWLFSAPVRDGSGIGSRAFRSDAERAGAVKPGHRSATRSHSVDVEHRNRNGQASHHRFRGGANSAGGGRTSSRFDQRNVGRSAPHIEADDPRQAGKLRDVPCAEHTAGRPGENGPDRPARSYRSRTNPAIGLHHPNGMEPRAATLALRALSREIACEGLQIPQIAGHHRREVRVGRSGRGALKLPDLRQNFVGDGDRMAPRAQAACQHSLVRGIHEGEEQTNGHRIAAAGTNAADDAVELCGCRSQNYISVGAHALAQTQTPLARNQWRLGASEEIVELGTRLPPDLEYVLKARASDQHHFSAASLEQSVGADGGATDKFRGERRAGFLLAPSTVDGGTDRRGRVRGRRWYFQNLQGSAAEENTVGKRAAGVDGDANHSPQIMPQERARPARIPPERVSSEIRLGSGRRGFPQNRLDLGNVIQVVTGKHQHDPLHALLSAFGMVAVVLPLRRIKRREQIKIGFAKSAK